jgi:O-antigen ligase
LKKWFATYDRIQDVVSQDTERFNKTSKDRHWILMKLIPAIKEKPIIGYGLDLDFQIVGNITAPKHAMHTHCEFTQIAIQFGLVGMGLFVLLFAAMFWYAANLPPPMNRFTVVLLLAVLIDISFNCSLYTDRQIYVILFSLTVVIAEISYRLQQNKKCNLEQYAEAVLKSGS